MYATKYGGVTGGVRILENKTWTQEVKDAPKILMKVIHLETAYVVPAVLLGIV